MVLEDSEMELVFEIEVAVSRSLHLAFSSYILGISLTIFVVLVVQRVLTERNYCQSLSWFDAL